MTLIDNWCFPVMPTQMESLYASLLLSAEQESLKLEFALKDKQIACIQNIVDPRDVVGILMTLRGG